MRISIHSLRIAVSILLGVMVSVQFVAAPAYAVTPSFSVVTPHLPQLASNTIYCSYDGTVKNQMMYRSLTALPVTRLLPYLPQTIASPKELVASQEAKQKASLPSFTPTATPSPTIAPVQPASPTPAVESISSSQATTIGGSRLNAEVLFALVNNHRASIGLPPFQQDPRVCEVAASRAPELDHEIYGGGGMHAGFYARNLGYWATENMISMPTEEAALQWWLNSPTHRSAIEGNYQYACVGCSGKSCAMIFTNFDPK